MSAPLAQPNFSLKTALLTSLPLIPMALGMNAADLMNGNAAGIDKDPDSNMRLVEVKALLAGQNWFDLRMVPYGLGDGVEMHWSRLADIGPASLLWFFSLFLNAAHSELAVTIVYPLLLLIPLVVALTWATSRLAPHLTARQLAPAICVIALQTIALRTHFVPGNIDHHNLQLIALIVFVGGCCGQRSFASGVIGGLGLIFGIMIGLDSVVPIAAIIAVLGVLWLLNPKDEARFLAGLGWGIIGLTCVGTLLFMPRPLSSEWCDSWTLPIGSIMAGLGVFLIAASQLGRYVTNRFVLAGLAGVSGVGLLATLLVVFPSCRNPLPLNDPLIDKYWMGLVSENFSAWEIFAQSPALLAVFAPAALTLVASVIAVKRGWVKLAQTLPAFGGFLASIVFASFYMRGVATLSIMTMPLLAVTLAHALANAKNLTGRLSAWVLLSPGLAMALCGALLNLGAKPSAQDTSRPASANSYYCVAPSDLANLKKLQSARLVSPFALSEYLTRQTKMRVAFAGYHRNYRENLEIIKWLTSPADVAQAAPLSLKVDYVLVCPNSLQFALMAEDYPNSLIATLMTNRAPSWLAAAVSLQDGGIVYRNTMHRVP